MERLSDSFANVAITASSATTETIDKRSRAGMRIYVPSGTSLTSLTVYDSHDGVTWFAAFDDSGLPVTISVAGGNSYPLPDTCWPSPYIRLVGDTSGTVGIAQGS